MCQTHNSLYDAYLLLYKMKGQTCLATLKCVCVTFQEMTLIEFPRKERVRVFKNKKDDLANLISHTILF